MTGPTCLQPPLSTGACGRLGQTRSFRSFVDCRPRFAKSARPQKRCRCKASAEAQTDEENEVQIEGIDQSYCDEFVCTSSPAVERNLRALARDVVRTSTWTTDLFADEVRYKVRDASMQHLSACKRNLVETATPATSVRANHSQDKFRSTEGIAQYKRQTYLAGAVKEPKVVKLDPFSL